MPSGDDRVSLDVIREAARGRVETSSIRVTAEEIGVEFNALARFLAGATPHGRNETLYRAWHSGEADKVKRLERENAELRKKLEECEAKLKR